MLTDTLYITGSCSIVDNLVIKNGAVLFENRGLAAQPFLVAAYQHFAINYPRFYKMDSLAKLGWLATEILLQTGFDKTTYLPEDIGLVFCNRNSSLDADIRYYETVKTIASPALFVYTLPNIVMGEICIRNNFKGENDFFIFEHFDAGFIQEYVSHLFGTGILQACICGWVEIIDNAYHAALYLVEKTGTAINATFTAENIYNIYQTANG
ncbi:MAG: hypothetical protein ABIU63_11570 [Chitinophagaceae bacterium]